MLMILFDDLLEKHADPLFNNLLKQHMLDEFKSIIDKHIQPQMGGFIDEQSVSLAILNSQVNNAEIMVKCSIFYIEQIGGCNCNDGPHEENGYFETLLKLTKNQIQFMTP